MKLFSKNSNACDHNPPMSQTDGQTDGQLIMAIPRYAMLRAVKTFACTCWYLRTENTFIVRQNRPTWRSKSNRTLTTTAATVTSVCPVQSMHGLDLTDAVNATLYIIDEHFSRDSLMCLLPVAFDILSHSQSTELTACTLIVGWVIGLRSSINTQRRTFWSVTLDFLM